MYVMSANKHLRRLNQLQNELENVYHEASLRLGLSDSASIILYTLLDMDGKCMLRDLIRLTALSKQTVHSALQNLRRDGIIDIECISTRARRISLTEAGQTYAQATAGRLLQAEASVFAGWSDADTERFFALYGRYVHDLNDKIGEF